MSIFLETQKRYFKTPKISNSYKMHFALLQTQETILQQIVIRCLFCSPCVLTGKNEFCILVGFEAVQE